MPPKTRRLLATTIVSLWFVIPVVAQPIPKLNSISREWLQRGTSTEVTIDGENLSDISRFVFSEENEITATITTAKSPVRLEASENGVFSSETPNDNKRVALRLVISPDATPGAREIRVITPTGVSNPLTIRLTDLPEILEVGGAHSITNAQNITLPVGLTGRIGEPGQIDFFRFTADKGERLIFNVIANRLGSPLDSSIAILDASGKELARNEDANGLDSLLDFTVPENGEYFLQIRDFRYQGGNDYKYHIYAGAIPYLDSIFPCGGERGKSVEITLNGRNLDGVTKMKMNIDAAAPLGQTEVRAHTAKGFSSPRTFDVSSYPEAIEAEPNDANTNATAISLPITVNGRIEKAKDVDIFKFKVEKGKRFIFEALATSLNSPLDAVLVLRDSQGAILQQNNGVGGANARIDQTFPEAGEYYVSVRDLLDRGGDAFVYRLAVRPPPEPGLSASVLSDAPRVSRGSRTVVRVEVARSGFNGPVEVTADDLPKGVEAAPLLIPAEFPGGFLELAASDDAELGSFPLKLVASALIKNKKISEPVQAVAGVKKVQVTTPGQRRKKTVTVRPSVKEGFLTVLDTPAFTVEFDTLSVQLEQNQGGHVRGEVKRRAGFKGEIKVSLEGFSAGQDAITKNVDVSPVTVSADKTTFEIPFRARLDSEVGTRSVVLKAEGTADGGPVTQFSGFIPLTITEFPYVLSTSLPRLAITALPPGSTSAAGEAEFSVKVARRGLFTDEIALSIDGLPEGIVASQTNLLHNVGEALIKLTTNEKAKPGTNNFTVIGTASVNGRTFTQKASEMTLTVNPPSDTRDTAQK